MKRIFALLSLVFTPFAASAADITEGLPVIGAPSDWGWKLIETAGPISEEMTWFHNDFIMPIITAITVFVIGLLGFILIKFSRKANPKPATFTHNTLIEIIWTVIPILIVVAIIVPSMKLLFKVDKIEEADLTLKITGMSAWYWSYDYPEYGIEELESRLKPEEELVEGDLRLLEVDEPLVLPVGKNIKILVTAEPLGMIHSWGVSSLKVKRDAIPGRINEGWFRIEEPGIYYGQCYELCGPGHAYMPIKVVAVEEEKFNEWVLTKDGKLEDKDLLKFADKVEDYPGDKAKLQKQIDEALKRKEEAIAAKEKAEAEAEKIQGKADEIVEEIDDIAKEAQEKIEDKTEEIKSLEIKEKL